ncbi:hypothetical protein E4H12_13105 [Candidatus Thorarchaeota archaeon]|nr:MAG: hypothetical protein E4H12_13105 [Candidatus Thorarchaeota archaeon]
MVRLTTVGNFLSGIGLTLLAFTIVVKVIATQPEQVLYPLFIWLIALGMLAVVLIISVINTFTEMTGFVHPDDKMMSNMLVYVMALGTLLVYGLLDGIDTTVQGYLYNMGTMIVIAYIFLFIFNFYGSRIAEGTEQGQVKEMTSRFMLVSLVLGIIMAGANLLFNWILTATASYTLSAGFLFGFAILLVFLMVIFLGRRYEPVGE